jgi:hypothetical protein
MKRAKPLINAKRPFSGHITAEDHSLLHALSALTEGSFGNAV